METKTIRETVRETIESYPDKYLKGLISQRSFVAIGTDGELFEIDNDRFVGIDDADADDMRVEILDFLDDFKYGFFDDEFGDSLMAEIVNNDVLWAWGADPVLLESYDEKMCLLEYVSHYGCIKMTKADTNEDDWVHAICVLDLDSHFNGFIYKTNRWNSENMIFCILKHE